MTSKITLCASLIIASVALAGCGDIEDKTVDRGFDSGPLGEEGGFQAGIWVDPNGCDHWIIDDGVEGYLSARLAPDGKPVCSGAALPNSVIGEYRRGNDPI